MPTAVVALDQLQSDIDSYKTQLESLSKPKLEERPITRSTKPKPKPKPQKTSAEKKYEDLLHTVLGKLNDWSQRMKALRSDIVVGPHERIATDMEMATQSEDAGSVRQHEIPEPSHARTCTLAQHAQPSTSENGIANGEACEASGDSMDNTRVDTTFSASDPAENVSVERAPRADSEPVAVEVSNRGSHTHATSCHPPRQPIISTETEERQTDIHNATASPLLPGHGREDQVDDEPAEVQTQLSTDLPDLANTDDASANDNSMQLIPLGPVQQEDTRMSEVEPEVAQQTAIIDTATLNSDDISANDNSTQLIPLGPVQQEDTRMSEVEPEVTQQTAIIDTATLNSDDISANDNSTQLIPLGPVQQEDTRMSEVEPEVTQQTAIIDTVTLNSDDTSANDNSTQLITAPGPVQQEDTPITDVEPEFTQQTAIINAVTSANHRRLATPGVARPSSNSEVGENSTWSSQHSDTSETLSPTSSITSRTDSIQTRFTTPDSTSMGEQVDQYPIPENNTSILHGLADESCYERHFIESKDTPTLARDQLGKDMLKTLDELSKMPNYVNKATLPWLAEMALQFNPKDDLKPEGDPDMQFNKFEKKDEYGIIVSRDDPVKGREFEWPDFKERASFMTTRQASWELAQFLSAPGKGVSYFCGLAKSTLWSSCPLYSGEQLDIKELTHVNEPYTHLGKKWSITPMHKEDDIFGSVNVGFMGTKLFLRVLAEDTERFEKSIRDKYKCKPCPQFVRHLNRFFEPKQLEALGIRFELLIQRPGDLIETKTNQYHQVLNLQDSLAISINYLSPGITPNFRNGDSPLEVCNECGLKGLYGRPGFHVKWVDPVVQAPGMNEAVVSTKRHKRKAPPEPLQAGARNTRGYVDSSETFNKTLRVIRSEAPSFSLPPQPNLDQQSVMHMAAAILSIPAIEQFKELVSAWRNRNEHIVLSKQGDPLKQCARYLKSASAKTAIGTFQLRHSRALLARLVDEWKTEHSLSRLGKKEKADLAQRLEIGDNELTNSLRDGRMWNEVCGQYPGLLPFIPLNSCPPFNISVQDWKQLDKGQLKTLHQLIDCDDSRRLSEAGMVLQNIVAYDSSLVFKWEQEDLDNQSLWGVVESVVAD
ncbi:histone demethylation 3d [Fusarium agapanthi]|uniref:Histone demethylation 3d n=1 Tax=Fusarium agapanthi TaxID=1803897 RepID=A0A9P5AY82_9HYPO|nr:histone demethylation 3d [Fusarium agapanthi]